MKNHEIVIYPLTLPGSHFSPFIPCLSQTNNMSPYPNPLAPMSDQDRISPYNINTISSRQVMRIKKNIDQGISS